MKKWIVFAAMVAVLAGCGSDEAKETSQSEKSTASTSTTEVSTSKTETTSSEKKDELKDVDFQIEGTAYKMKILDSWKVSPEEENIALGAQDEETSEGIMVFGIKKEKAEGFDGFKNVMKEQMSSTEEFQITEGTTKEEAYQTSHYAGEKYSFTAKSEGMNVEVRYYFLETETDYVSINFIARPSVFTKNADAITEMLNSFVVA